MTQQKKIKIAYLEGMKKFIEAFMYCGDDDLVVKAGLASKSLEEFTKKFKQNKDTKNEELVYQQTLNDFMTLMQKKMK